MLISALKCLGGRSFCGSSVQVVCRASFDEGLGERVESLDSANKLQTR